MGEPGDLLAGNSWLIGLIVLLLAALLILRWQGTKNRDNKR
ncbi:MAG: hypothetical protein AAFR97_01310 [Bacteroidota bacterium]